LPFNEHECFEQYVTQLVEWMAVQDGSYQAQSNLKFLSVLKDPCHELADAQPVDIPPMLPKILNLIRMIWVNSEFYNTKERLIGILRKVRHQIILLCGKAPVSCPSFRPSVCLSVCRSVP